MPSKSDTGSSTIRTPKQLREYLDRGGFSCATIFTATRNGTFFQFSMAKVFPKSPIEDIPNKDPIFTPFTILDDRFQVPGLE
jgi:hypothetical protein